MALTDGGAQLTMPVAPTGMMGGYGGGFGNGFGGDGWWILLLILFAGGAWGGNGWGGNGGNMPGYSQVNDFSQLERENDIIREQICNQFANVNQTLANGFQTIQTSFANAELSRSNTQAALMGQLYQMSMADLQRGCDIQNAVTGGFAATNYANASNTRDIIDSQTSGTRAILDALTAQRIEDKNAQIAELTTRNNMLALQASQQAQNAYLLQSLRPYPVPAFTVLPPFTTPDAGAAASTST